ncbi:MAG: HlyC/CorC family transporter [Ruminococcaceae bacterium]|nr:HlyC/CorC family transporter [Oscillospiraceae bacterium]
MDIVKQLLLQLVLILLNAFFAATEIALISLNEKKVEALAEEGDKKAQRMLKIIKDPTKFLSAIQVGITLAGFLGSAFAADNFAERLSGWLTRTFELPATAYGAIETTSVIVITLILSYFTLVLGELVPKRIAMRHKEKLANAVCGIISVLTTILKPVIWFLTVSTNGVLRLFGIDPNEKEEAVSEEDIVIMLDAGADEGTLNEDDITYIKNVFKLDRLTAAEIMTQRSSIVALPDTAGREEILAAIRTEGYSRIPVYKDTLDNVIGILQVREYLLHFEEPDFQLTDALLQPIFVPESLALDLLLKQMQEERVHLAVVISEYGVVSGVVSIEDIVEEILGEIWDERDEVVEFFRPQKDGSFLVDGSVSLADVAEHFGIELETEAISFGGLFAEVLGKVPEAGDTLTLEGLAMTVTATELHRITEVQILPVSSAEKPEEEK